MTDKELIRVLRDEDVTDIRDMMDCMEEAADRLEALLIENGRLCEIAKHVPRWVNAEERMPEPGVYTLCLLRWGDYEILKFDNLADEWQGQNPKVSYFPETVSYWMPIQAHSGADIQYAYEIYEDNAGGLHLAVLDKSGTCVYYLTNFDRELVLSTLADLKAGGDPIADNWEGGEANPIECYREINERVDARNGSAWELEEDME